MSYQPVKLAVSMQIDTDRWRAHYGQHCEFPDAVIAYVEKLRESPAWSVSAIRALSVKTDTTPDLSPVLAGLVAVRDMMRASIEDENADRQLTVEEAERHLTQIIGALVTPIP